MPRALTQRSLKLRGKGQTQTRSRKMVRQTGDYVFFWKPNAENGEASQWYRSDFTEESPSLDLVEFSESSTDGSTSVEPQQTGPVLFKTAEHYMMYYKAILFNDQVIAQHVLDEGSPSAVRALGRQVKNFDDAVWKKNREKIVYNANMLKFGQNETLKKWLLETGDKQLVESSPKDKVWGIGKSAARALENKDQWGLNLLGEALMKVRGELRKQETTLEPIGGPSE